jgi:hypothetical protein
MSCIKRFFDFRLIVLLTPTIFFVSLVCSMLLLYSCRESVSYVDKKGNNDVLIYEDSLISIQRSTEKLGDEIIISHIVTRRDTFSTANYLISTISDQIPLLKPRDSFTVTYNVTEQWYKSFSDTSFDARNLARNLQINTRFQITYYFPLNKFEDDKFSIDFTLGLKINGTIHTFYRKDTLFKRSVHMPLHL